MIARALVVCGRHSPIRMGVCVAGFVIRRPAGPRRQPFAGDVAGILDFAVRMVAGDRLYVDLVDVNPPLIFWLNLAPAWVADRLALDPAVVFVAMVLLLQAASLALCRAPMARLAEL